MAGRGSTKKTPTLVKDSVDTYRLRSETLREHLESLFPIQVPIQLSPDGKTYYSFKVPRKLTPDEKDYIYENLRYAKQENNLWDS